MAKNFCVRIRPDSFECSAVEYKNSQVTLLESEEFSTAEQTQNYLRNKSNINYILYDNQILKSTQYINRNVTGRSAINSTIYAKLQKELVDVDKVRFKYSVSEDNPKKETIKYAVHGIYQNTRSYKKLETISTPHNANILTLENYSLYALCKKMLPSTLNFIAIWADEKSISLVAGNTQELVYSRNESLINTGQTLHQEISKNVMFAMQRARELKFDTLIVNGSVATDESLFHELYEQTNLKVSTFCPTQEYFKNFDSKAFHKHMIEISSVFVEYELDFISSEIKAHKQYHKAQKYLVAVLIAICGYTLFDAYEKYFHYTTASAQYNMSFERIDGLKEDLTLDTVQNKQTLYSIFDIMKEKNSFNFIEQTQNIKKSVEYANENSKYIDLTIDFENFKWTKGEVSTLQLTQNYTFGDLSQLNTLRKDIDTIESKLQNNISIEQDLDLEKLSGTVSFNFYGEENNEK
jgi:uncharacterized protein YkvS